MTHATHPTLHVAAGNPESRLAGLEHTVAELTTELTRVAAVTLSNTHEIRETLARLDAADNRESSKRTQSAPPDGDPPTKRTQSNPPSTARRHT